MFGKLLMFSMEQNIQLAIVISSLREILGSKTQTLIINQKKIDDSPILKMCWFNSLKFPKLAFKLMKSQL